MEFPKEMQQAKRWCAWFYHESQTNSLHQRAKLPHDLNSHLLKAMASSTNSATWGTYAQANAADRFAENHPERAKVMNYGGAGFMMGDGWCFLDLDNIPNEIDDYSPLENGFARQILDLLDNTYCEISQSGLGLHFIFRVNSSVHQFTTKEHDHELYTSGRLAALTGHVLDPDLSLKITTIGQQTWVKLHQVIFGAYQEPSADLENNFANIQTSRGQLSTAGKQIINQIMHSHDARQFNWWMTADLPDVSTAKSGRQVYDYNHRLIAYDPSSQDMACCNMLAYWVHRMTGQYNGQLIDEIFRQTRLFRAKWTRHDGNGTYGQRTIAKAIARKSRQTNRRSVMA